MLYDTLIVPMTFKVWKQDAGTPLELFCSIVLAIIVVPLQLFKNMLGLNQDITDLVEEFGDSASEITGSVVGTDD